MVKFHFTLSKLRKQTFFAKIWQKNAKFQNPAGSLAPCPPSDARDRVSKSYDAASQEHGGNGR